MRKFGFCGFAALLAVVLIVGAGVTVSAALKAYSRAEEGYEAQHRAALTHIAISHAKHRSRVPVVHLQNVDWLRPAPAR
jgi:hypothetical protein